VDAGGSGSGGGGVGGCCRYTRLTRTHHLNTPPRVLLSAVNILHTEHLMNGNGASDILAQAARKSPRIKRQFAVPLAGRSGGGEQEEADLLFQATYVHAGETSSCEKRDGGRMCDVRMLVQRPSRDSDGPVVHYGVIASGGQEIECAVTRDEAKKVLGALCFEREAAGLMNDFPCLVIRGICDYADSHKSRRWQGYAAATAAAFAKELLECVPAQEVQEMARIVEVMKDGESIFLTSAEPSHFADRTATAPVHATVQRVEQHVSEMRADDNVARKGMMGCCNWEGASG
jgi:hypothetical protein